MTGGGNIFINKILRTIKKAVPGAAQIEIVFLSVDGFMLIFTLNDETVLPEIKRALGWKQTIPVVLERPEKNEILATAT